jgi:tetratricopeptide (TPR) repeat protein
VSPYDEAALKNAGLAERLLGRPSAALIHYLQLSMVHETPLALILIGQAHLEAGDSAAASRYFEQALVKDPKSLTAHFNLARIRATHPNPELQDPRQALHHAMAALANNGSKEAYILAVLAAARAQLGDWPGATNTIQRAIDLAAEAQNWRQHGEFEAQKRLFAAHQPYLDARLLTNNLPLE